MITFILGSIVFTILATYIMKVIHKRMEFVNIIGRIHGPYGYPLVGDSFEFLFSNRSDLMKISRARSEKYKPIYLSWAGQYPEVHILRPEHAEIVFKSTTNITKSLAYEFLHDWLGTGLLTSTGKKWSERRKMITPAFHFEILEDSIEIFGEKSKCLVDLLEKEACGKEFDIYPMITSCALDIICESAMGTQVNAQNNKDSKYVRTVYEVSELILHRALRPWLYPDVVWKMTSQGKLFHNNMKTLHDFTNEVIMERSKARLNDKSSTENVSGDVIGKRKKMAFLDLLLEASEKGHNLSQADIREEVDTFMFEGHDTTAANIAWAIFLLGNNPEVQERVVQELDEIFGDFDRLATMQDLNNMKYLEMVIKETLRLYPSVPFIGRHVSEDMVIGGYQIPAGCLLNIELFTIHRCEDQFPNPEKFDPDNFLPERTKLRHPYAYVPFSAGSRNCIGQKYALFEEKTVLSAILRRFRIEATEKQEDITLIMDLVLRPETGVKVKIYPRIISTKL